MIWVAAVLAHGHVHAEVNGAPRDAAHLRAAKPEPEHFAVTPAHDLAWCASLPRAKGFLLVANGHAAALPAHTCLAHWAVLHFNDCAVAWPTETADVAHFLVRRQREGEDYQGRDDSCARHGIPATALRMGTGAGDALRPKAWSHAGPHAAALSTGLATALALRECFPAARLVGVGFDFDGPSWRHDYAREREFAARVGLFERAPRGAPLPPDLTSCAATAAPPSPPAHTLAASSPSPPAHTVAAELGSCGAWAAEGECARNPAYMRVHCVPACAAADKDRREAYVYALPGSLPEGGDVDAHLAGCCSDLLTSLYSLRQTGTGRRIVVLVTDPRIASSRLRRLGEVRVVDALRPPGCADWTRGTALGLVDFDAVVVLDAATVVRRPIDFVFDALGNATAAAALSDDRACPTDSLVGSLSAEQDGFNTGILALRPSAELFRDFVGEAAGPCPAEGAQGALNQLLAPLRRGGGVKCLSPLLNCRPGSPEGARCVEDAYVLHWPAAKPWQAWWDSGRAQPAAGLAGFQVRSVELWQHAYREMRRHLGA